MNTKERLKEQRRANRSLGWPIGTGMSMGFVVGFGLNALSSGSSFAPEWAFYLIAYGLGAASVLAVWWLAGYELKRSHRTETR